MYFVTIDVQNKLKLFWNINGINDIGLMIEKTILEIEKYYSGILIDKYTIMPDHIHIIINILKISKIVGADPRICPNLDNFPNDNLDNGNKLEINKRRNSNINNEGRKWDSARTHSYSLSEIIQRFKILSTNRYIKGIKSNNWPRFFKRLWQRNFLPAGRQVMKG
ncbi:MAG TPA: hypothetical protein PK370_02705 [Candidatus Woesebacteria bacterium]|nr:hypothetical protein [Candidatus Woesebacteria bacterium]